MISLTLKGQQELKLDLEMISEMLSMLAKLLGKLSGNLSVLAQFLGILEA